MAADMPSWVHLMTSAASLDPQLPEGDTARDTEFPALTPDEQQRLAWMLRAFYASTWRVGRRLGLTGAQADETAQESFAIVARKLSSVEVGHERAFVLGVALRLAGNARRRAAHRLERVHESSEAPEPADSQPLAEEVLLRKQRCHDLDRILGAMSDSHREVLLLYEIEELTLPEIAEVLGIPEGTAASRLRRARLEFSRRAKAHSGLRDGWEDP